MSETYYKAVFKFGELGMYGLIPGIKEAMQNELMRVYSIYAGKCNSGITEKLNAEFNHLYPNYFEDNKGKDWWDLVDYNRFMAEGYNRLIVNELNKTDASKVLNFYVDPTEVNFTGYLKVNRKATIEFYLKEV